MEIIPQVSNTKGNLAIHIPSHESALDQFKPCPFQCKSMGRNKKRSFDGYKYAPGSEWQCVNSCRSCVRGNMGAVCRQSP